MSLPKRSPNDDPARPVELAVAGRMETVSHHPLGLQCRMGRRSRPTSDRKFIEVERISIPNPALVRNLQVAQIQLGRIQVASNGWRCRWSRNGSRLERQTCTEGSVSDQERKKSKIQTFSINGYQGGRPEGWKITQALCYRLVDEGRLPGVRISERGNRGMFIIQEEDIAKFLGAAEAETVNR